jgi:hypothetical protein
MAPHADAAAVSATISIFAPGLTNSRTLFLGSCAFIPMTAGILIG